MITERTTVEHIDKCTQWKANLQVTTARKNFEMVYKTN